ncbi:MAG TPA: acyltransferase [Geomonas sp.]|nr:acyltransferase [Geomonas sp.]
MREQTKGSSLRQWAGLFLARASRDTSSGQFIPTIDGLRFMAILSVLLFHLYTFVSRKNEAGAAADPLGAAFGCGDIGVQLFFIISGFIIALPFAKGHLGLGSRPRLKSYYLRRLTRLEPPYIICLLISFPISAAIIHLSYPQLLPHLLASLFYLHNLTYGEMSAVNFVAWSLEVELQFYLLAPAISLIFTISSRLRRRTLLAALIVFFSLVSYWAAGPSRLTLSILVMAQYFLTGFLLADVYLGEWREGIRTSPGWDLVSLAAWLTIYSAHHAGKSGDLFLPVPMFLAYLAAFKGSLSSRFFQSPAVYTIGGMCYTLYLYHYTCIFSVGRVLEKTGVISGRPPWQQLLMLGGVALPATFVFCSALFIMVEKPCMSRRWHTGIVERVSCALQKLGVLRQGAPAPFPAGSPVPESAGAAEQQAPSN